jgi:hypothetical protein
MAGSASPERWHRLKTADAKGKAVCEIADYLWREQADWRRRAREAASWYEGFAINTLAATAYTKPGVLARRGHYEQVYWNTPRALVQSLTAKVAGRQRPKPQFVCTDTDWVTKRRAKRLERFAEATLYQPQGQYRDAWDLGIRVFVDACVFGMGVIKAFADVENTRIADERVLPWELLFDPVEAERGAPLNVFHRYRYDKDRLIARFPQYEKEINAARDDTKEVKGYGENLRIARQCVVREAWRLPLGENDPGRHVIAVNGKCLLDEPWTRDEFPFLILRYAPHLLGTGATSLVEEAIPLAEELNVTVERMREGERKLAAGIVSYEEGSIDDTAIADNKIGALVPRTPGTAPPDFVQPQGFSGTTIDWMRLHYDKCFELTGVSQMGATSRKEPGVTAGVALRTIAQMETERFSVVYGAYEQMLAVDLTRHHVACAREVAEANGGHFVQRWPGSRFLSEIDWEKADLEDDKYYIQGHAVAGLVNTPADRLQLGQDLFNAGTISQDAFLRITQLKDVDGELKTKNVQHELVEHYIESWLDATADDQDEGVFRYRPPVPFMDHAEAILQVATAYMEAELDDAPDWNLQWFTTFITQCSNFISSASQQINPAAPPPPPARQLPGAPGGAPMPPPSAGPSQMLN